MIEGRMLLCLKTIENAFSTADRALRFAIARRLHDLEQRKNVRRKAPEYQVFFSGLIRSVGAERMIRLRESLSDQGILSDTSSVGLSCHTSTFPDPVVYLSAFCCVGRRHPEATARDFRSESYSV